MFQNRFKSINGDLEVERPQTGNQQSEAHVLDQTDFMRMSGHNSSNASSTKFSLAKNLEEVKIKNL